MIHVTVVAYPQCAKHMLTGRYPKESDTVEIGAANVEDDFHDMYDIAVFHPLSMHSYQLNISHQFAFHPCIDGAAEIYKRLKGIEVFKYGCKGEGSPSLLLEQFLLLNLVVLLQLESSSSIMIVGMGDALHCQFLVNFAPILRETNIIITQNWSLNMFY